MALSARFLIVLFLCISSSILRVNSLLQNYVSLVISLHRYHNTPNICFLISQENGDLQRYTLSHVLSREFSRKGLQTLVSSFERFPNYINHYYDKRTDAPLVVVQLLSVRDVDEFRDITRKIPISYPAWLVIFENTFDPSICQYCNEPIGNIFGLQFNTLMTVLCCNDSLLKEWWGIRNNRTEMADFGAWTIDDGLEAYATEGLYARRQDLNGTGLRIVFVKNSAFQTIDDGKIGGFFGAVVMELQRVMNFEITMIKETEVFGTWNPTTRSWTGAIGEVGRKKADLGVGEFTITSRRLSVVDFTAPIIFTHTYLYFKAHDGSGVQWSAYFRAFQYQIWLTTCFIVLMTAILVTLFKIKDGMRSSMNLFIEHFLSTWGIFCQQGLAEFPAQTPLRITYFSIFVSSLVVSAAYSASLTSFLTVSSSAVPFSSLEDFVKAGTYDLIVVQDSSEWDLCYTSVDPIMSKMMNLMKSKDRLPRDLIEGLEQVCSERVALLTSNAVLKTNNIKLPCKLVKIPTGRSDSLGMIMARGSGYLNAVNYHIQRFQDNGLMSRLKQMYFTRPYTPEDPYSVVTLWGIAPILCVLAGGFVIALIVFFCEIFTSRCRRHSRNRLMRKS